LHSREPITDGTCEFNYINIFLVIKTASEEKDLGVIVHESLKSSRQCIEAVIKSANKTLGMISRTFMYKNKVTMLQLYKSLV